MPKLEIKVLSENDVDELLRLQECIVETLPCHDLYYPEHHHNFYRWLSSHDNGVGIGAFSNNKMVGYFVIYYPETSDEHLLLAMNIGAAHWSEVARWGLIGVKAKYRQSGVVREMIMKAMELLQHRQLRYLYGTVSPHNYPSLKMVFEHGFSIKKIVPLFDNLTRCLIYKDMASPIVIPAYSIAVDHNDVAAQHTLLAQGFYGYSLCKKDDGFTIVYGHNTPDKERMGGLA